MKTLKGSFIFPAKKLKIFISAAIVASSLASTSSFAKTDDISKIVERYSDANSFSEVVQSSNKWFFAELKKDIPKRLQDKFQKDIGEKIEEGLRRKFQENLLPALKDRAKEYLGEKFVTDLAENEFISEIFKGMPYMSFIAPALSAGGPSETQIMMQILLTAIAESKQEILDSIEENFQDGTEAQLNSLISDVDIFNSRGDIYKQTIAASLNDYSSDANLVKKRLEQKDDRAMENAHLYLLVTSLQIEIQKQYTRYLVEVEHQGLSPAKIEAEFKKEFNAVLFTILNDGINYLVDSRLGSLDEWRKSYEAAFGKVELVSRITDTSQVPAGYDPNQARFYQYTLNDKPILFKVLRTNEKGRCPGYFHVFDPLGNKVGSIRAGCVLTPRLHELLPTIEPILKKHKNDPAAFDKYLKLGYGPIMELFDSWWSYLDRGDRIRSEVDAYMLAIPDRYEQTCEQSGKVANFVGNFQFHSITASKAKKICAPCNVNTVFEGRRRLNYYCAYD